MEDFPASADFLADARRSIPQFYASATREDRCLLDGLVMAYAALVVGMPSPRDGLDHVPPVPLRVWAVIEQAAWAASEVTEPRILLDSVAWALTAGKSAAYGEQPE